MALTREREKIASGAMVRPVIRRGARGRFLLAVLWCVIGVEWTAAESASALAERNFAEAYEMEWGHGDLEKAAGLYRMACERAGEEQRELAAVALYRLGLCEARLGQDEAAARAWEEAIQKHGETDAAEAARKRLASWRREMAMVTLVGLVVHPDGTPAAGAWVMAGESSEASLLRTDTNGAFLAERRMAEGPDEAGRFLPVYAEDAIGRVGGLALVEPGHDRRVEVTVRLMPLTRLTGLVVDEERKPVADAEIVVTGVPDHPRRVPFSYVRLLEPIRSDVGGRFEIEGILPSLRLQLMANRDGYSLKTAGEWTAGEADKVVTIVLERMGRGWIEGRVTDERGRPLETLVSVWTMPPDSQGIKEVRTGSDGRYRLDFLPERPLRLEAQSAEGYAARRVAGVWGGGASVDMVLTRGPAVRKEAPAGAPAPDVDAVVVRGPSLRPPAAGGDVTLLYFWARDLTSEPPALLQEWHRKYGGRGLRVVCVHDHSGVPEDLVRMGDRLGLGYTLAVDRYGPAADSEARSSLTFARYGATPGASALVDAEGRIVTSALRLDETEEALRQALTARASKAENKVPERTGVAPGSPAPAWAVGRWVRAVPEMQELAEAERRRGRVVVVRLGSAYVDSFLQSAGGGAPHVLDQIMRAYGEAGVLCAWILPSAEAGMETEELALRLCREASIGVDRDGITYRAYGVGAYTENWVIDVDGTAFARCADSQLARTVKTLLRRRGSLGP